MNKKKIPKGIIASVIIIVISALAFVSGYLKESAISNAEELKVEIANSEIILDRLNSKITEILDSDQQSIVLGNDHLRDAILLSSELEIVNNTLTPLERNVFLDKIGRELFFYESIMRHTYQGAITKHFYIDTNSSDYYFATKDVDGVDFYFSEEEYFSFNESDLLMNALSHEDFLASQHLQMQDDILNSGVIYHSWFTDYGKKDHWIEFFKTKLFTLQQNITNDKTVLADLEAKASFFGYGVTLITVTTILATAMAAQLNDREREMEFSHIKAKIYDNESMIITKGNWYAIPVLIIALIIAALGLLLPIIIF